MNPNIDIDTIQPTRGLMTPLWSIATSGRAAKQPSRPAGGTPRRLAASSVSARAAGRRGPAPLQPFSVR